MPHHGLGRGSLSLARPRDAPHPCPAPRPRDARRGGGAYPAVQAQCAPPARSAEPQAGAARTPVRLARRRVGRPGPRPRPRAPLQRPRGYLAATVGSGKDTLRRRSGSGNRDASHSLRCGFRPAPTRPRRPLADGERRAPIAAGLLRPARPAAARRRRSVAPRVPAARAPRGPGCRGPMQDSCVWRPPGVCLSLGRPLPPPFADGKTRPEGMKPRLGPFGLAAFAGPPPRRAGLLAGPPALAPLGPIPSHLPRRASRGAPMSAPTPEPWCALVLSLF